MSILHRRDSSHIEIRTKTASELLVTTRISSAGFKKVRESVNAHSGNCIPQTCGDNIDSEDRDQRQDDINNEKKCFWKVHKQNTQSA
jgi:hypothetical protein